MLVDGSFEVAAPPDRVLAHLFDAHLMASCLPGCESLEQLDADRYRAVVAMALAGVKARFDLVVQITGRNADGITAETRGEEGGNASTLSATSTVKLAPVVAGTRVDYTSDVAVTGRLGRFALGMMKKQAQTLGDAFAGNLQAKLAREGGSAAAVPTVEASAPPASQTSPASQAQRASPAPHTSHASQAPPTAPLAAEPSRPAPAMASASAASPERKPHNAFVRWLRRLFGLDRAAH